MRPQKPYYLVRVDEENDEKKTNSGIFVVGERQAPLCTGQVVETYDYAPFKRGHKVLYKRWVGEEIKIEKVLHRLLKDEDIIALL